MKVLVIGSGGREHALAWALTRCPSVTALYCSPGSDALQRLAGARLAPTGSYEALADFAAQEKIELTVVGPEGPLAEGIVDRFSQRGLTILGPTREAARLESSKIFAKEFMCRQRIPTARFRAFADFAAACKFLRQPEFGYPLVMKADGLAAGKGVAICTDRGEAETILGRMMLDEAFGAAGKKVVVEEYLVGEEISFMVLSDGKEHLPLAAAQDHKRLQEGDRGPNTGGMGAFSCDELLSVERTKRIRESIIAPTLAGMAREGWPFRGILYAGLIMTAEGPKVLEFNVRLGDPETQPLLLRVKGDLAEGFLSAARGSLQSGNLSWVPDAALCVVLASPGYPDKPVTGDEIHGLEEPQGDDETQVFHAGTRWLDGRWFTGGGRVLGVTARGITLAQAAARAYARIERISFKGMQYRRDIGARHL